MIWRLPETRVRASAEMATGRTRAATAAISESVSGRPSSWSAAEVGSEYIVPMLGGSKAVVHMDCTVAVDSERSIHYADRLWQWIQRRY